MHPKQPGKDPVFDKAYNELYERLYYFAFRIIHHEDDAGSLVNDAFLISWKKGENFGDPEGIRKILYNTIWQDCIDYSRRKKVESENFRQWVSEQNFSPEDPASNLVTEAELFALIKEALPKLPQVGKKTIEGLYLDGREVKDMARERGIRENSIYDTKKNALEKLRELLRRPKVQFWLAVSAFWRAHWKN